jgi:hypothetical protein
MFTNVTFAHIRTEGAASVIKVSNTVFANMGYLGNHNIGAGRAVDLRNQSIDSLILVNNTFVNFQDRIIRHYYTPTLPPPTGPMGYLLFDHNTIVNGMSYYGLFALGTTGSKVIITNNLLIDPFSLGNDTCYDRQIEFASSGEKDPYGKNRITWIFSEANDATQWTISNNYYAISDSGKAFYDQYASEGVTGEGSPLTWYINSKLGADSVNAFKKITIAPKTIPNLMTKLMRWYRSPSGGNKTINTPAAWVFGDPDVHPYTDPYDFDRKGYQWLEDALDCSYCASEMLVSTDGKVVGDTRWSYGECTGSTMNISMAAGWNLISVTLLQSNYNAEVVFPGKYGAMFAYDQVSGDYVETPILELGLGYWAYYTSATTVPINGAVANTIATACKRGWNLIGSRETEIQVADLQLSAGSIYGSAFYYDTGIGDYAETDVILPGQGIWVFVTADCELTIP